MHYSLILTATGLLATVSGHGLVTSIQGANGVTMPGLTVADGTPRDCSSNSCGSQADTAIMDDDEIESGETGPLGYTEGNGNVDAAVMIRNFMGGAAAPTNQGASDSSGIEDNIDQSLLSGGGEEEEGSATESSDNDNSGGGSFLDGLFGRSKSSTAAHNRYRKSNRRMTPRGGAVLGLRQFGNFFGGGDSSASEAEGTETESPQETSVAASAGQGAASGLPTCADDGTVTLTFRQINQDGAGPLEAAVDGTSGGTDAAAFQDAEVVTDVPGIGFGGLSLATNTDFEMKVRMPEGMTCEGSSGGAEGVCVVRVRNSALAGPFGGSAAFTMSEGAKKRAVEFRKAKRAELLEGGGEAGAVAVVV